MESIFLNLVNLSITASWIVLGVLIFRLAFKKAPKWINCALWALVGVRLIFPFSVESVLSLIPSAETLPPNMVEKPSFDINTGFNVIDAPVNEYLGGHYFEGVTVPANNALNITRIFTIIWLLGVLAMLIYTAVSYFRLKSRMSTATILRDNIRQSEKVASPFVLGLIKPVIYLPYNINERDAAFVIAHETAHIKRGDHFIKPVGFLILTVYWFNPVLWLAYILLCRDIELACDEKVIKELNDEERKSYSSALLSCSIKRRAIAACPLAFGEVSVKERIKSVLSYKKPAFWIIAVAVAASIIFAVCFMTNPKTGGIKNDELDLSDIESLNIGAELPYLNYADEKYVIFNGSGGLFIYNQDSLEISDRITFDKTKELGFDRYVGFVVSADGKYVYIGEDTLGESPFVCNYKYDIEKKEFEKIEPISPDDFERAKTGSLPSVTDSQYQEEFAGVDLSYVNSVTYADMGASFAYLRATSWDMKDLQIVVCEKETGDSSVYYPWNQYKEPDFFNVIEKRIEETEKPLEKAEATRTSCYETPEYPLWGEFEITSPFGLQNGGGFHLGVDLTPKENPLGKPIFAVKSGEVTFAGERDFYGNTVRIKHNDREETIYAHCSELLVKEGQQVKQGDVIARVGESGKANGPHLHFGYIVDNENVDPFSETDEDNLKFSNIIRKERGDKMVEADLRGWKLCSGMLMNSSREISSGNSFDFTKYIEDENLIDYLNTAMRTKGYLGFNMDLTEFTSVQLYDYKYQPKEKTGFGEDRMYFKVQYNIYDQIGGTSGIAELIVTESKEGLPVISEVYFNTKDSLDKQVRGGISVRSGDVYWKNYDKAALNQALENQKKS